MSSPDVLPRAVALLHTHTALLARTRQTHQTLRARLTTAFPPSSRPEPISAVLSQPLLDASSTQPVKLEPSPEPESPKRPPPDRPDLPPAKRAKMEKYRNYVPEEETVRNDYSQRYVDTGEWPQNWVQGAELERRFEEYPKQRRLLSLKKDAVSSFSHPPTYLAHSLAPDPTSHTSLLSLLCPHPSSPKFDIILLDPSRSPHTWTWDTLLSLPVPQLAGDPSFVFMWVGDGADEGLERGREVLAKWGYRRAEDIVWIKTNKASCKGPGEDAPTATLLTHTKQHCLMGIRGTVRRSTDSWFVHCNVDTDVIIWPGDPSDPTRKPPELHTLIENFCLGQRRLELFGRPSSLRRGWLTVGSFPTSPTSPLPADAEPYTRESYAARFPEGVRAVVPSSGEIDALRPKSPNRGGGGGGGGQGGPNLLAPPPNMQRAVPRPAPGQPGPQHFPHPHMQQQQHHQQQQHPLPQHPPQQQMQIPMQVAHGQPMSVQMAYQQQLQAQAQAQAQAQGFGGGFRREEGMGIVPMGMGMPMGMGGMPMGVGVGMPMGGMQGMGQGMQGMGMMPINQGMQGMGGGMQGMGGMPMQGMQGMGGMGGMPMQGMGMMGMGQFQPQQAQQQHAQQQQRGQQGMWPGGGGGMGWQQQHGPHGQQGGQGGWQGQQRGGGGQW